MDRQVFDRRIIVQTDKIREAVKDLFLTGMQYKQEQGTFQGSHKDLQNMTQELVVELTGVALVAGATDAVREGQGQPSLN